MSDGHAGSLKLSNIMLECDCQSPSSIEEHLGGETRCSWRPDIGRGSFELFLVLDDSPTADLRQISSRFQKDAGPAKEPAISIYGLGGKHLRTNSHVRRAGK